MLFRDILRCQHIKKLVYDSGRTHHTVPLDAFYGERGHLLFFKRLVNLVLDIVDYPNLLSFIGNAIINRYLGKKGLTVSSIGIKSGRFVWKPHVRLTVDFDFVLVMHFVKAYLNLKV